MFRARSLARFQRYVGGNDRERGIFVVVVVVVGTSTKRRRCVQREREREILRDLVSV